MSTSLPTTLAERKAISGAPKACGVLSIIFASIVLLSALGGACGGFAGASLLPNMEFEVGGAKLSLDEARMAPEQVEVLNLVKDHFGGIYRMVGIISVAFAVMSAWLLALGIGQVGYRRWARGQTVLWGWAALAVIVGVVVYFTAVIGPASTRILDVASKLSHDMHNLPAHIDFDGFASAVGFTTGIFMAFIFAPYPIVLLAIFSGQRAKTAMNA